jgi:hypothetical protein
MLVHGEQKVELHKPLPPSGTFTSESRTIGAFDKGKDKGAVLLNQTTWRNEAGEVVATLTGSSFCRADGGSAAAHRRPARGAQIRRASRPLRRHRHPRGQRPSSTA